MSKKGNNKKSKNEIIKDDAQLSIDDVKEIEKITAEENPTITEEVEDKLEENNEVIEESNSDADYIHDESIISDEAFKRQLKEQKYKDKIKQKELYKQYKKDKKERKKKNKEEIKKLKDKDEIRDFKIQKHEEELNIRSELGVKTKGERFSLYIKRTVLRGTLQTWLLILIMVTTYITINLYAQKINFPKIDVTTNKIYTLSDDSKEYIKKINDNIKIYSYGFLENSSVCDLLKQYAANSDKITYELLDDNSNPEIKVKYNLLSETQVIIIEGPVSSKTLYAQELSSYDSLTGNQIDLTENAITNAIYSSLSVNQPKIYYVAGHSDEFTTNMYQTSNAMLTEDGFKVDEINLLKTGKVPDDCDLLIIQGSSSDLFDSESDAIKKYINNGGNLIITSSFNNQKPISSFKNLKSIIDIYGATLDNAGFIVESDLNKTLRGNKYFVLPEFNSESDITRPLYDYTMDNRYNNSFVTFYTPGRIILPSEEKQASDKLVVTKLTSSSENSSFLENEGNKVTNGSNVIAAMITKTIKEGEEEKDKIQSSVILIADATFCSDYQITVENQLVTVSHMGKNIALYTNSIAKVTDKEDFMSIRKEQYTASFNPTNGQDLVVKIIVFTFPIIIIITGIVVKTIRRRKN